MSSRRMKEVAAGLAVASALAGCSTPLVQSVPVKGQQDLTGMFYALPMAQSQLVAERKVVDADAVAQAEKEARELAAAAGERKKELEQATAALDAARKLAAAAKAPAKDELALRLGIAQATFDVQKAAADLAAAQAKAARAVADEAAKAKGECRETAALTALPNAPDPKARYVLQHQPSAFRDDQLSVTVGPNGLLGTAGAVAVDQSRAVLLSVVEALAGARTPRSVGMRVLQQPLGAPAVACPSFKATLVFDPASQADVDQVNARLTQQASRLQLCVKGSSTGPVPVGPAAPEAAGFVYRAVQPLQLTLSNRAGADVDCSTSVGNESASLNVLAPDRSTRFVLPLDGVVFAKASTKYTFKDGQPVELSLERSSTALAVASLPVDMLKALVSIPASIIKLRVDYETQSAALVNAQASVQNAEIALLAAQRQLQDKLKEPAGP